VIEVFSGCLPSLEESALKEFTATFVIVSQVVIVPSTAFKMAFEVTFLGIVWRDKGEFRSAERVSGPRMLFRLETTYRIV
jgi:hypothetical protein